MVDIISHIGVAPLVQEEHGGAKSAYAYDHLTRIQMARGAQGGEIDLGKYLRSVDYDRVRRAKMVAESNFTVANRSKQQSYYPDKKRGRSPYKNYVSSDKKGNGKGTKRSETPYEKRGRYNDQPHSPKTDRRR